MKFRTRFTPHDPSLYTLNQQGEASMTRQEEADEADINLVMERFMRTGQIPKINGSQPRYGDNIAIEYSDALIIVKQAEAAFAELPALVRREFYNDPAQMEAFLADPENDARAVELGLKSYREPSDNTLLKEVAKNTKKEEKPLEKT